MAQGDGLVDEVAAASQTQQPTKTSPPESRRHSHETVASLSPAGSWSAHRWIRLATETASDVVDVINDFGVDRSSCAFFVIARSRACGDACDFTGGVGADRADVTDFTHDCTCDERVASSHDKSTVILSDWGGDCKGVVCVRRLEQRGAKQEDQPTMETNIRNHGDDEDDGARDKVDRITYDR